VKREKNIIKNVIRIDLYHLIKNSNVCSAMIFYEYLKKRDLGDCKLMMGSHDVLVAMQTWENNNMLTWRNY
jgi:hypothetical protein